MSIFNSLGSNYRSSFIWSRLFGRGSSKDSQQLAQQLSEHYGGVAELTYKGRQALQRALEQANLPKGSSVGINGFTCYVVYQAVERAGLVPVFIDIAKGQLDFGQRELQAIHEHMPLKAVIVQNSLGYPVDMGAIQKFCHQKSITIIEDLAHSIGAVYATNDEAGRVGVFTMLSFSQDKPVDVVAGGAVINRSGKAEVSKPSTTLISLTQRTINRLYPLWTAGIRTTYAFGFGKLLHATLKKLHLMATPMNDNVNGIQAMDSATAHLIREKWLVRNEELKHRQEIAAIYQAKIDASLRCVDNLHGKPAYLRFPLLVDDRESLVLYLRSYGVYIGDTWYDAPIGPKRYLAKTSYTTGLCPEAEKVTKHIINLPTHVHVSRTAAERIARLVNEWHTKRKVSSS